MDTTQVTVDQLEMMQHAIGFSSRKITGIKHRVLHCYRNYYQAGGEDIAKWDKLVELGLADTHNIDNFYWVSGNGVALIKRVVGLKRVEFVE